MDIYSFAPERQHAPAGGCQHGGFYSCRVTPEGDEVPGQAAEIEVQIMNGCYFDSEIVPTPADVRHVTIRTTDVSVLSAEFVAVSKLSYPNAHRPADLRDVARLAEAGCLEDARTIAALLERTSIRRFVTAADVLGVATQADMAGLLDSLHFHIIRSLLHWDFINVERLDRWQAFVLLDLDDDVLGAASRLEAFSEELLDKARILEKARRPIMKLGMLLTLARVLGCNPTVLRDAPFRERLLRAVDRAAARPDLWLAHAKIVFRIHGALTRIERLLGGQRDWLWDGVAFHSIVERVLYSDPSRFTLLAFVESMHRALAERRASAAGCEAALRRALLDRSVSSSRVDGRLAGH